MNASHRGDATIAPASAGRSGSPAAAAPIAFDCGRCGACCARFRVSFYWAEADARGLPATLVEPIGPWYACMAGTNTAAPRCQALAGDVGEQVHCTVYAQRPATCRELQAGDDQCRLARRHYGLPSPAEPETAGASPADDRGSSGT